MKIALLMENSQAAKAPIVSAQLHAVADKYGHEVYNLGMLDANSPYLTYVHLGIMAGILLNSGAVDFVVTGCGTGQGALLSCNSHAGVLCGYCIDPSDAFLFRQINNGNAVSIPFAKGWGWAAELNLADMFEKLFNGPAGQGYPADKACAQQNNARILSQVKQELVNLNYLQSLSHVDPGLIAAVGQFPGFLEYLQYNTRDRAYVDFINECIKSVKL